ncbi:MAG: Ldh family oxidoreductase [Polynucleobacter sp.]|uniref:Ldh family oxidoreductase n=1 Tax=Polynucleobacter sp. TaxID=2029855 RepID=UPI00271DB2C5|nr:Ldh family oxidoreductase [Polynucleobacter sp.]MDO8713468.1 Ldh family oxidoreductase [Polynucleobacter sp.]
MNLSYREMVELASTGLRSAGVSQKAASETAQFLALAELDGLASHGLARVSQYAGHAKQGRIELTSKITVRSFKASCALVDAGDGLAFPALRAATDLSVNLASKTGIGLVAVTNSHHFGVAGHFAEAAARAGYISLLLGNTPAAMPMVGGSKAIFGTNPLAAAFPITNADPLVIDMSLSAVARGKLLVAAKKGESIPEGWALTSEGKPTRNPQEGLKGLMVPMGGDKGALLALIIELLVVGLSGSRFSYEADSFFDAKGNRPRIGQLLITIDPGLAGSKIFANKMQGFLKTLSSDAGIRLPGQRRFKLRKVGIKEGVNIPDVVIQEIQAGIRQSWNG